jgi:hypothetical protein
MKDSVDCTGDSVLNFVSFTSIDGTVIYSFSKSERDTFEMILKSSTIEKLNPVASPVWKNYLTLTFAAGKTEKYKLYEQFIIQEMEASPKKYLFTENVFWLYNKARAVLGEVSKEYQRPSKGK